MKIINRRGLLKWIAANFICLQIPSMSKAGCVATSTPHFSAPKLVWIVLRGAMDSLDAVIPAFDPDLLLHRHAIIEPTIDAMFPLDGAFGLNRGLANMYGWYQRKQLMPVVAVASTHRQRIHSDGLYMLQSGRDNVSSGNSWLCRALEVSGKKGIVASPAYPIHLNGEPSEDLYSENVVAVAEETFCKLCCQFQSQHGVFDRRNTVDQHPINAHSTVNSLDPFHDLAVAAGAILSCQESPDAIGLEMRGWDTHDNQQKRIARQFTVLDSAIQAMKVSMGERTWNNTVIILATEFGRSVVMNEVLGTDHGTASCLFIAGGAVDGGCVRGNWPGLANNELYDGRDLMPTSDIRQWISMVLIQHWGLSEAQVTTIFPGIKPACSV